MRQQFLIEKLNIFTLENNKFLFSFGIALQSILAFHWNEDSFNLNFNSNSCAIKCNVLWKFKWCMYSDAPVFFCQKGEKCCPTGAFNEECSASCGPYDPEGLLYSF